MIDALRDVIQNGQPIVTEAGNWRSVEAELREAGIPFWGWQRFQSGDGGDCIGVSVPAGDYERAQAIAEMTAGGDSLWGYLLKIVVLLALLALVAMVLMGGAL